MFITLLQKCLESQDLLVMLCIFHMYYFCRMEVLEYSRMTDYVKVLLEKKFIFFAKNV